MICSYFHLQDYGISLNWADLSASGLIFLLDHNRNAVDSTAEIEKIVLCTCKEPALQLLSMGLFPCAPQRPSVAVDVNMLEFARGLFQNLAPNTTAWCETVEKFLYQRGFKLKSRVRKLEYSED